MAESERKKNINIFVVAPYGIAAAVQPMIMWICNNQKMIINETKRNDATSNVCTLPRLLPNEKLFALYEWNNFTFYTQRLNIRKCILYRCSTFITVSMHNVISHITSFLLFFFVVWQSFVCSPKQVVRLCAPAQVEIGMPVHVCGAAKCLVHVLRQWTQINMPCWLHILGGLRKI